jgi:hypothetical protein
MSINNYFFQSKIFILFTIFFVSKSNQKHIIEHCQASFFQNSFQVTQKQDLTKLYLYISMKNSLNDVDQKKSNIHAKHTAKITDFCDD